MATTGWYARPRTTHAHERSAQTPTTHTHKHTRFGLAGRVGTGTIGVFGTDGMVAVPATKGEHSHSLTLLLNCWLECACVCVCVVVLSAEAAAECALEFRVCAVSEPCSVYHQWRAVCVECRAN